ncbi:MAG TPA: carbohydrate-binding family 9-like protein [Mobilitalea sp.]|nr:carbohydrate-binding family 9-like protein [Mobilitalea sp.]
MKDIRYRIPKPKIEFNPPVYLCQRATKPFYLDGNINKPFWEEASFTEDFVDIQGDGMPAPRFRTRAKMLWDNDNLYFSAILEGDEIWATVTDRDDVIFRDNDFEIFLDPDSDTQQYFEFEMNAMNTVWDLFLTKAYRDQGLAINHWDIRGLKTAVYIDGELNNPVAKNRYWSVEVVMPFEVLKECSYEKRIPRDGEYWRVNFSRVQWLVDVKEGKYTKKIDKNTYLPYSEDNWVWAPTGVINIHYPELWGFVFFCTEEETSKSGCDLRYTIPEDEKIKWRLRTVYYAEHCFMDEKGYYTSDLSELTDLCIDGLSVIVETTKNSFEIRCLSSDNTREISLFSDGKIIIN